MLIFKILIIILIVIILLLVSLVILAYFIYTKNFTRRRSIDITHTNIVKRYPRIVNHYNNILNHKYEDVYITSFDNLKLHGYYFKCDKETKNTIIAVHGWQGDAISDASCYCDFLYDDYNILNIDLRAHGKSEGKYIGFSILDYQDVNKWIDYLNDRFKDINIILFGISMGAATSAISIGSNKENVVGAILDSGFYNPFEELIYTLKGKPRALGAIVLNICNIISKKLAHYDVKKFDIMPYLLKAKCPILFLYGGKDDFVDIKFTLNAYNLYQNKKYIHQFLNSKHVCGYLDEEDEYIRVVNDFLNTIRKE